MGILGLIPFLEKATRAITLKDLRGSTVGIDTYCWLHKGAIACADKLIRGDITDLHIKFCLKYVNLLLSNDIKPVLVFDGRHLPAKELTENRRRTTRKDAKEKAKELLREGKVNEARTYINRAVNITHEMAHQLIAECRKRNVDCIVAPFEADGELGFLSRNKLIDFVITEDSDLTLFGCEKVIFKFDLNGNGLLYEAAHIHKVMGCKEDRYDFQTLFLKFQLMCILSGCDYLDSLKGIGLSKALKFVMMTEETDDLKRCLNKVPSYLNLKVTVDDEYKDSFLKALATFRHMIVYDPRIRKQCRLTEPSDKELLYCSNAGEKVDEDLAFQLAIGNVNPFTLKQLDCWDPSELNTEKYPSIWSANQSSQAKKKRTTSNCISIENDKTPTKRKILKPICLLEEEEEECDNKNTSIDILNMYLDELPQDRTTNESVLKSSSPPEPKKIRLSLPSSDRESKNPFLKKKTDEESTDNGEKDGKKHMSLLQQANEIKTEISKFKRTTIQDKKVNVVSRFFSPTSTATVVRIEESKEKIRNEVVIDVGRKKDEEKLKALEIEEESIQDLTIEKESNEEPPIDSDIAAFDNIDCNVPVHQPFEDETQPPSQLIVPEDGAEKPEELQSENDSEEYLPMEMVEADYSESDTAAEQLNLQRINEQSPLPWQEVNQEINVLDTISPAQLVQNKENEHVNNENTADDMILIEDDSPPPMKTTPSTRTGAKLSQKKTKLKNDKKQKTLMTFFQKK